MPTKVLGHVSDSSEDSSVPSFSFKTPCSFTISAVTVEIDNNPVGNSVHNNLFVHSLKYELNIV